MSQTDTMAAPAETGTEQFDVLVVGAGISGIGAAYHLTTQCPDKSFVILEALDSFGGTWLTLGRAADCHGGRDPQVHGRGHRRQ